MYVYRFLTDPTVSPEQRGMLRDADTRRLFNIKTDTEIRDTLASLLGQVGPPVQVVYRCTHCVQSTLNRLCPRWCSTPACVWTAE